MGTSGLTVLPWEVYSYEQLQIESYSYELHYLNDEKVSEQALAKLGRYYSTLVAGTAQDLADWSLLHAFEPGHH